MFELFDASDYLYYSIRIFLIRFKQNMDAPMRLYKILFYGRNLYDYGQKYMYNI